MPYYHVFIEHVDKRGKERELMYYDLTKEAVDRDIAKPFMENKKF